MNNKSTQILLIIGIIAILGGAVYAAMNLTKKQPGSATNTTNSTTGPTRTTNGVLMNIETELKGNATFSRPFFVPSTKEIKITVTFTAATVTILNPAGVTITPENAADQNVKYTFKQATSQGVFEISTPTSGIWQVQVTSSDETAHHMAVWIEAPVSEKATITPSKKVYAAGEDIVITATATDNGRPVPGSRWDIVYGAYRGVTPSQVLPFLVFDDGQHQDGEANDGVFSGTVPGAFLHGPYHIEGDVSFPSGLNLNTFVIVETPAAQ